MKSPSGTWRALAATARLANLPSVVSNVSLGLILGYPQITTASAALAMLAGVALYLSGGFFNDWADRDWDAEHRPERALPGGLFPPRIYLAIAIALVALALAAAALTGPAALAAAAMIALFIGLYTWLHKKSAWAVLPMGMCRALLPALGLAATGAAGMWAAAAIAGAGLLAHVAGISWLARNESRRVRDAGIRQAPWFFPASAFLMMAGCLFHMGLRPLDAFLALIPYALWTGYGVLRRGMDVGARVSALLAGIPLVDWMLLLPLFLAAQAPAAALWLPPLAFVAGRLAQRFTPAT